MGWISNRRRAAVRGRRAEGVAGATLDKGNDAPAASATDIASRAYDAPVTNSSAEVTIFVQMGQPHALGVDQSIKHTFRTVPGIGDRALEEPENDSIFISQGRDVGLPEHPYGVTPKAMQHAVATIAARLP